MAALAIALEFKLPEQLGGLKRRLEGAGRGWAFGFGANLVAFRFVPTVITRFTPLPWAVAILALLLLAAAQAVRWMIVGGVRARLVHAGVPRAPAFAIAVYAGTFFPMVFPWNPAGGVTPWPELVQLADIIGERGVSALMALSAGLVADGIRLGVERTARRRALLYVAAGILLPLVTYAQGAWKIGRIEAERASAPSVKIVLLQPSIGASERWEKTRAEAILSNLTRLTESAERKGAELTIWPEAAYPYVIGHSSRRAPIGSYAILQPGVHGPVLTGALTSTGSDSYNSALVAAADGTLSPPYDKIHLLWFGETVPLADLSPWLRRTFARGTGLVPGEKQVLLSSGRIHASVLNCFEDTLPGAGREAMEPRPNLLVNITNDAWFAGSEESELHARMAIMRAVEERRDMVRAVNFGPTTWVDAAGRVRAKYVSVIPGTLLTEPALLESPPTFFGRFGEVPWVLVASVITAFFVARQKRRRAQNAEGARSESLA